jgi:hypothetical protein
MIDLLTRLEPRTRSADLTPGLAARIRDAAWLLSRQWVFGEFDGEDAGTPIAATLTVEWHTVDRAHLSGGTVSLTGASAPPLNVLVERLPVRRYTSWTVRQRVDAGRELLRQLAQRGLTADRTGVLSNYPLAPATADFRIADPDGARLLDVVSGRLADGELLFHDAGPAGTYPVGVTPSSAAGSALDAWRRWIAVTISEAAPNDPPSPYDAERFESDFAVSSSSLNVKFEADGYRGRDLDWFAFDVTSGDAATAAPTTKTFQVVPTPVRFRGMPSPRYWEFEDSVLDLGAVDAAPSDLARVALLEFAFAYGNDIFFCPMQLPIGTFSTISSLRVADTFGISTSIPDATVSTAFARWSFFGMAVDDGSLRTGLLLPAVAGHTIEAAAVEEARLFRDEMANLVWAVEHSVEGDTGRPLQRGEVSARTRAAQPVPDTDAILRYHLQSAVPPEWFPLVLAQPSSDLRRMLVLQFLSPSTVSPQGRLLPPIGGLVHEAEIAREGLKLARQYLRARWIDGSTHVWTRITRSVGRGQGSSGLRYDTAEFS